MCGTKQKQKEGEMKAPEYCSQKAELPFMYVCVHE